MASNLPAKHKERYARQIVLPEIGERGQEKILNARVIIIGAGGLGCPAAIYLAAAGVGKITLVDNDRVALSNLNRQIAFEEADIGRLKTEALADRLRDIRHDICVNIISSNLTAENAEAIISGHDILLDCTDNFITRDAINSACVKLKTKWIFAAIGRFSAYLTAFNPAANNSPCYRCFQPSPHDMGESASCADAGIIGALTGIIGSMQALETIKIIAGIGDISGRLTRFNAINGEWKSSKIKPDPACMTCRKHKI